MSTGVTEASAPGKEHALASGTRGRDETLRAFLDAYWLRPENALWMTLRSMALGTCELHRPSVDFGCGDGVFTFLHCGGAFNPNFDVFCATKPLTRSSLFGDAEPRSDMFDHMSDEYRPEIVVRPAVGLDVGVDIKPTMLAKARRLDFYDRLVAHDNNHPLPFEDDSFETVYCNTAYWVSEIDRFLRELGRITRPGGTIVLHVKLDSMQRFTLEAFRDVLGDRCLRQLGSGRMACWPTVADRSTWESRFSAAGLTIKDAIPFVTRTHAHVWDIGLRPFAPMLVTMANAMTPSTRATVKRDWVDLCLDLLSPLCVPHLDLFDGKNEPAEMQYVLTPG